MIAYGTGIAPVNLPLMNRDAGGFQMKQGGIYSPVDAQSFRLRNVGLA